MADLDRVKMLLAKLDQAGAVSMRDFENVLGKDGVTEYESLWRQELDKRSLFETKPDEIKKYEEIVKAADFDNNKADGITKIGKRSKRDHNGNTSNVSLRNRSEGKYERAVEHLQEIISEDESLRVWFDRELDFSVGSESVSIDCAGIPRTVTSRSTHKQSSGLATKRSKDDLKRDVIENAIAVMERNGKVEEEIRKRIDEEQSVILKQKLARLTLRKR